MHCLMKWFPFSFLSQEPAGALAMANVRFIKTNLESGEESGKRDE